MPSARDLKRALDRVRTAIPAQRKLEGDRRNIRLGLERITRAIQKEQSWTGVHVGGTNGKGSICTLLSYMFKLSGVSHGVFTSPSLFGSRNGVAINGMYPNQRLYESEMRNVQARFRKAASGWTFQTGEDPGELTPFELDTAVAFRIFNALHVKYGIVEVGMGGTSDATNAMHEKGVTVISKIGLDHQEYLGNTIEEIASVKAGIMRPFVPCIIDHTNSVEVLRVLTDHARSIGAPYYLTDDAAELLSPIDTDKFQLEDYEKQNLLCALLAFKKLFPNMEIDLNKLLSKRPYPPGRKDLISVRDLTNGLREQPVFVDGAHNMLGVQALSTYVDNQMRRGDEPVTWIMGLSASKTKPFASLIETLVRPQDRFAFVEYQPLPNEPAAAPAPLGREIAEAIVGSSSQQLYDGDPSVDAALQWACRQAGEDGHIIVTGSLYLIRELYNTEGVHTRRRFKTMRPGRSQLWYYTQLAQTRELTPDEAREFKQARRHWRLNPIRSDALVSDDADREQQPPPRTSPVVSPETRAVQRCAAYHQKQAARYAQAIECIELDTENGVPDRKKSKAAAAAVEATPLPGPERVDILSTVKELIRRQGEHIAAYQGAMHELRGYKVAIPEMKFMSYAKIYGRPPGPSRRKSKVASAPEAEPQSETRLPEEANQRDNDPKQ
ncbi:dihydrofolate synthetase Fol3 [Cordyceps fumosorosea ARSEF 2679]|uniref:Dihydrofolate synthetase Fol3 n=1 Tax=Cordyceps fumosorosea (strain ARSEF 2679) TaxID=1081104 RepID=A0A167PNR6_CORFA|nr:dihydrofolate synthetase Fol3 [Cordyceps fumosorosea ARSEF 2679]OAA56863.1 dihydrofolate synthetase Fol3 [Cordyceps fumosorosea ARSEF 2679]